MLFLEKHFDLVSSSKLADNSMPVLTSSKYEEKEISLSIESVSRPATFNTGHHSKFKHLVGEKLHKSNNIENVKNLAESLPSESDGFKVYKDFAAVPLGGTGGQLAIFQVFFLFVFNCLI